MELCHCGKPLHYKDLVTRLLVEQFIEMFGPEMRVTLLDGRSWMVPRHYLALHGIAADDIPNLGFKEIQRGTLFVTPERKECQ